MKNELEEINKDLNNNLQEIKKINTEINNNIEKIKNLNKNNKNEIGIEDNLQVAQIDWTNSEINKILNEGFDAGIKILLPDFMENQVIQLKDAILNSGVQDILKNQINNVLKAVEELKNKKIENVTEVKNSLEAENFIEGISDLLDKEIDNVKENKIITDKVADKLKDEKNTIVEQVENSFNVSFDNQTKYFENMEKYIANWKNAYNSQDFSKMQREYNKMVKTMNELMPLENIINEFRTIENLQSLIKNNNKNFDLSDEALELANKLIN